MSQKRAYFMSIMCSDALRGAFTLQMKRIYVHSLAYYYFDGSNIAWNMSLVGVQLWKRVCMVSCNTETVRY